MSYIKQADSGGGGDISGSGATNQIAFFNGTKTITSDSDFTVNATTGRITVTGGLDMPTGSAAAPALAITGDTNTGVFSAGADQIGFTVAGSDALGVGANKNVTVGGASGNAGQVLTSAGSGGATTWKDAAGGMLPRAQQMVASSSEYFEEVLGVTNGINIEAASVMTTTSWNNGTARFRPHCFASAGTLGNVTMQLTTLGLTGVQTRDVYVAIWGMTQSGAPATKKCEATIQLNASSSLGQISLPWAAEAGQDLLVEAGEWYWVAFSSTGSGSPGFRFWQSLRLPSSTIQVTTGTGFNVFQTSYVLSSDVPAIGDSPVFDGGDSSGITWAFMGLNIS